MQYRLTSVLGLLLALSACATPAERCRVDATRDLATVRGLIAETRANISRGYAFDTEYERRPRLTFCYGGWRHRVGVNFCTEEDLVRRDRPVAIDLRAEQEKLAGLVEKERQLQARARMALATCPPR